MRDVIRAALAALSADPLAMIGFCALVVGAVALFSDWLDRRRARRRRATQEVRDA